MNYQLHPIQIAIASMFFSILIPQAAQAYPFGQKEVDQSKFVAIAVPFSGGKQYNLIILEQISAAQSCWQEKADQPGVIDPLLLKFDFTGICGRNTDSNGYSIRHAGQDLALDYRLSVVRENGHIVLMGYPLKNPQAPKLKIAQTQSNAEGFLKLELEPGWRFAKRTYNGKPLGHIYFTRDQAPSPETDTIAEAPTDALPPLDSADDSPQPVADPLPPLPSTPDQIPASPHTRPQESVPLPEPQNATPGPKSTADRQSERDELTNLITSPIKIPAPKPSRSHRFPPQTTPSHARRTGAISTPRPETDSELPVLNGESPPPGLSAPPPSNRYQHPSRYATTNKQQKRVRLVAKPPLPAGFFSRPIPIPVPPPQRLSPPSPSPSTVPVPSTPDPDLNSSSILPVPQGDAPLGRFNPDPDIYVASRDGSRASQLAAVSSTEDPPPPPLDAQSLLRYRVIVQIADTAQYQKIKTLVPDAFRSTYQGRSVLQVGAYETQTEADERLDMLNLEGIEGILDIR